MYIPRKILIKVAIEFLCLFGLIAYFWITHNIVGFVLVGSVTGVYLYNTVLGMYRLNRIMKMIVRELTLLIPPNQEEQ